MALACEITAWMQMLALHGHQARRWEPKRLRLRILSAAGQLAVSGRTETLHLSSHAPWTALTLQALQRLKTAITNPRAWRLGTQPPPRRPRNTPGQWNRRHRDDLGHTVTPTRENQNRHRPGGHITINISRAKDL